MLLETLVSVYKDEDNELSVHDIDLIVPLSYATLASRLTNGSRRSLLKALQYKKRFPQATLVFSNPNHSGFDECDVREYELKKQLLDGVSHICAKTCSNSIQEAEAVRAAVQQISPRRILVICGEVHSRSARIIWREIFPEATILIRCVPYACEYQEDHPFWIERQAMRWFFASLVRQVLLSLPFRMGIEMLRNRHHRTG